MRPRLKAARGAAAAFVRAQPFVVLCFSLMVTLPVANAFSHDFASAYALTGWALMAGALLTFACIVAADRRGDGD